MLLLKVFVAVHKLPVPCNTHQQFYPRRTCRADICRSGQLWRSSDTLSAASRWSYRTHSRSLMTGTLWQAYKAVLSVDKKLDWLCLANKLQKQAAVHILFLKCPHPLPSANMSNPSHILPVEYALISMMFVVSYWPVDGADSRGKVCLQFSDKALCQTLDAGLVCCLWDRQKHTLNATVCSCTQ